MTPKPPTVADLSWIGDLKFSVTFNTLEDAERGVGIPAGYYGRGAVAPGVILDGEGVAGPSPVAALGAALASCMSVDVTQILTKGRHPLRALRSRLVADRAREDPHRVLRVTLHFTIDGDVGTDAVERAITLSREKYCSVWHSMRQDIDFQVTFEIRGRKSVSG